ncbi:unnamed protein product, partial [Protopolystoma xenopodis]
SNETTQKPASCTNLHADASKTEADSWEGGDGASGSGPFLQTLNRLSSELWNSLRQQTSETDNRQLRFVLDQPVPQNGSVWKAANVNLNGSRYFAFQVRCPFEQLHRLFALIPFPDFVMIYHV